MTTDVPGLATLVGEDAAGGRVWMVDGEIVDDEGLQATAERQWQRDYGSQALLDRELGPNLVGLDLHKAAMADLKARGIYAGDETQQQYLDAIERVSP